MCKRPPDEISVYAIERCLEIYKVYVQRNIEIYTIINYSSQRVYLINAGSISTEPTLVFPQ